MLHCTPPAWMVATCDVASLDNLCPNLLLLKVAIAGQRKFDNVRSNHALFSKIRFMVRLGAIATIGLIDIFGEKIAAWPKFIEVS
jgi:hypothetical protein